MTRYRRARPQILTPLGWLTILALAILVFCFVGSH